MINRNINNVFRLRLFMLKNEDDFLSATFIAKSLNLKPLVIMQYLYRAYNRGWVQRRSIPCDNLFGNPNIKIRNSQYKIVHKGDWFGLTARGINRDTNNIRSTKVISNNKLEVVE